jgi:kynurenine formamidase
MCNACVIKAISSRPPPGGAVPADPERDAARLSRMGIQPERAIDLTHTLRQDFPSFFGPAFERTQEKTFKTDGFNLQKIAFFEHVGTHFDAPLHYSRDGASMDEVPVDSLVCPIAVIDVRAKAAKDDDYRMSLDDLSGFERENGCIPEGACVAMLSGWESHLPTERFRNEDAKGVLHFPGVHGDVADFLVAERDVRCMAVDTMSLDHGASTEFPFHYRWLGAGRYGIENVANLAALPPLGATLVAGAPKFEGATGGPGQVIALL